MKHVFWALALVAATFAPAWADDEMKPGSWTITATTTIPGMKPVVITNAVCIKGQNPLLRQKGCDEPQIEKNGVELTFRVNCTVDKYKAVTEGHMSTGGDTLEGTATTRVMMGDKVINQETAYHGKWLGPCT